ncbi:MBL fold metallo-hydrolase [Roseospira marina]|uniref:MBL fold metallo-hydrolase n=1 Tax=Roseospira marina TaxID=140057 RepID=A0A5M6IG66_9PROT|nr:MBL fold metallo-hydrolase [Roseospira marina]KAA5607253.1 MBL fold metallo-hydrolase [Roseospira marina]MBB4312595.1 phosphoribosyl 1,2-cyclic phosphate phosphodiesterase [Roseospira marina]MBB5085389.1 phosphoribosyl 1,2-cyclic phosphate phosphodiesterase [Roseospira marina]
MQVTILGCGAAPGVPSIAGGWGDCDPAEPRNRRTRASILVTPNGAGQGDAPDDAVPDPILVDTSPDMRDQLLAAGVRQLSAVIYTHAHADHLHGLDDLREVNRALHGPLDIHADTATLNVIAARFPYAVAPLPDEMRWISRPLLVPRLMDGPFTLAGVPVTPFIQDHKVMKTQGLRFGAGFAYSTDVVSLDEAAFEVLQGIHTWVVGCISWKPHPTHAHVDQVLAWAERVQPRRLILTHMGLGLDYAALRRALPADAEPAYDGMVLDIPDTAD